MRWASAPMAELGGAQGSSERISGAQCAHIAVVLVHLQPPHRGARGGIRWKAGGDGGHDLGLHQARYQ
jgi:hypothetical protein